MDRLQFIDSVSICLPDTEAVVTLPFSLFTSDHGYAVIGLPVLDGTFLYRPLAYSSLKAAKIVCAHTHAGITMLDSNIYGVVNRVGS